MYSAVKAEDTFYRRAENQDTVKFQYIVTIYIYGDKFLSLVKREETLEGWSQELDIVHWKAYVGGKI